ncbi:hypothetical protein KAI65_01730 [Candidatus Parcubacteria bacterium]|nr:hypothetical protein [Candidatus Parcubacteria bacterium]
MENYLEKIIEKKVFEKKCENIDEMAEFYVEKIKKNFEKYNKESFVCNDGPINMSNFISLMNL